MEVNGYLPSHVRVFTDDENNFKPQIITEAVSYTHLYTENEFASAPSFHYVLKDVIRIEE